MNGNVTRVSSDEAVEADSTDWQRLRSLTDEDLEAAIRNDPDSFPLEEADIVRQMGSRHRYEVFRDAGGCWRWALRSVGGEVLAVSGRAHASRSEALQSIEDVRLALIGAGSEAA